MRKSIIVNGNREEILIKDRSAHHVNFVFNGKEYNVNLKAEHSNEMVLESEAQNQRIFFDGERALVAGAEVSLSNVNMSRRKGNQDHDSEMNAPMPGSIFKVNVKVGDEVKKGDTLLIMEAMKMEHAIKASHDGTVLKLFFNEGQLVEAGAQLVELSSLSEKED